MAKNAFMLFLVLAVVASTLFATMANAATNPVARFPANTGFAGQGQFRQGMQTGIAGQGQAGAIAAPQQNFPAQIGLGQQRGAGITVGDLPGQTSNSPAGPIVGAAGGPAGGGGPGTCACITAPCNCGGTGVQTPAGQSPANNLPGQPSSPNSIPFNPNWDIAYTRAAPQTTGAGQPVTGTGNLGHPLDPRFQTQPGTAWQAGTGQLGMGQQGAGQFVRQ